MGVLASVPWCCVFPTGLASLGLASSVAARSLGFAMPALLVLSVVFFARAHYLVWVKRHVSRPARWMTALLTLLAAGFWALRFLPPAWWLGG